MSGNAVPRKDVGTVRPRWASLAAVVLGLALATSACSGGGDAGGTSAVAGQPGAVDPTDPLAPRPLLEPTTLTVSMVTRAEIFAAVLMADKLGELAKENISVEYVTLQSSDALPALAQGRTDVAAAGITATLFNAVAEGADIRLVFPGPTDNTVDGLWVRTDPQTGDPVPVTTIGSSGGAATTAVVPISRYLGETGESITDVEFVQLPIEDLPFAVENGVVSSSWVNSPLHLAIEGKDVAERVVTYGPTEYGGGYVMGPNLLRDRPEVGEAFVRALTRTSQKYLSGDYKANEKTLFLLATALDRRPEEISSTPSLTYGTELTTDHFQTAQGIWLEIGDLLTYSTALEPSAYADPRFVDAVTGS